MQSILIAISPIGNPALAAAATDPAKVCMNEGMSQSGRIDRTMFDMAAWPAVLNMPIRFADLDVLWHVNNAAAIVMLQEARITFTQTLDLPPIESFGLRTVVGAMTVEYAAEINFPGMVEIASGLVRLGNSSFTFAQLIRHNGKPCVYSLVTMVVSDRDGAQRMPDAMRGAFAQRAMLKVGS